MHKTLNLDQISIWETTPLNVALVDSILREVVQEVMRGEVYVAIYRRQHYRIECEPEGYDPGIMFIHNHFKDCRGNPLFLRYIPELPRKTSIHEYALELGPVYRMYYEAFQRMTVEHEQAACIPYKLAAYSILEGRYELS